MSTIRDLLQVIIEEEVKHQQALADLRALQAKYDTLKTEHEKWQSSALTSEKS